MFLRRLWRARLWRVIGRRAAIKRYVISYMPAKSRRGLRKPDIQANNRVSDNGISIVLSGEYKSAIWFQASVKYSALFAVGITGDRVAEETSRQSKERKVKG